jgi:two-component system, OmpR family, response regulator
VRVLVVEDNEAMADAVRRGLRAEGFDVDVTHDGLDGLWRAREFPYDVIVLDILLPGMNGYVICRSLREGGVTTPILMLTAKDGDDDEAEGLDLGADDFLTKPFSFTVLVARINALIRRANPTRSSPRIVVGEMELDTMDMTCTVGGARVDLTAREYSLLEALARRQGQPLTRNELQDLVWGADKASMSNIVDVYVGYVRRKLERAGATSEIVETVRGIGYRMVR